MVIPAAIASRDCVGYCSVTSFQVLSPTMDKKMAPVTNIPTTIAASISKKCRQNGISAACGLYGSWLAVACPAKAGSERCRMVGLECGFGS